MTRPIVYLAGFDVFRPDAAAYGATLKVLCDELGFRGVFPLDAEIGPGLAPAHQARQIYESNIASIQCCDVVMANLADFRGAGEPDSGTAFEVGFAVAHGKPVFAYTSDVAPLIDRVPRHPSAGRRPECMRGYLIEDFGLPVNLMLACSATIVSGGPRDCLQEIAVSLNVRPLPA
ncbi:nucleoside 2-deoxyribosyltransferase [Burkholderia cepacia]|jgi:nucleoside 2-deoxyribosyltransferase|uniref:Nucleoside 2-deoxyribosyltransferase n=1 Tax=Burkholderia contaminans TaxID=488447 RepID=A0ABD7YFU3_9BURK|nr:MULTISPECIES: nucleoside 2-deoxyribosyltransferase [Burkholderia]EKS9798949.1 nucleoside 2-deoxyribosyltransferase [Burkholderia cepacia]EKS9805903.1 nucleoside 2-deoxyribosyltransferase [Burkholderia cepacia]EKS9813451.1 nucleoside 2-deoxyribosyltransferase [Burkholderia cepacia]EKS9820290.1 nucleoside 2-deoxyribosyltransferase [Burkholderia cepacia]EKS9828155.1 nucleoside 2-deoxyribosyltransferase [Burkholderia cepacia]